MAVLETVPEDVPEDVQEVAQTIAREDAVRVHALQHQVKKLLKRKIIVGKHDELERKGAYKAPFLSYRKKEENENEYESLY